MERTETTHVSTFSGGLVTDVAPELIKDSQYSYALNMQLDNGELKPLDYIYKIKFGTVKNLGGNTSTFDQILRTETIVGYNSFNNYGIVFTTSNTTKYCNIYRIDFVDVTKDVTDLTPDVYRIASGEYGFSTNIQSTFVYENDETIKLYFVDGKNSLRVINILELYTTDAQLDATPYVNLNTFKFNGYSNGQLIAGKIQYCYQAFKKYGSETVISPLSNLIDITTSDITGATQNIQIKGGEVNASTGVGVNLTLSFNNKYGMNYINIISVHYTDKQAEPEIKIIERLEITDGINIINYKDSGASFLTELTLEEFTDSIKNDIIGATITKMYNRLFIANLLDNTFDVEYDARAYRCDKSNTIKLLNSRGETSIYTTSNILSIPEKDDCIAVANIDDDATFKNFKYRPVDSSDPFYGSYSFVMGGAGKYIKYNFCVSDVILDYNVYNNKDVVTSGLGRNVSGSKMDALVTSTLIDNNTFYNDNSKIEIFDKAGSYVIPNYSDKVFTSLLTGYSRDEIYRFGIVFYNKKGIPSPVHWIGDIRFPDSNECSQFYRGGNFKHGLNGGITTDRTSRELFGRALGIKFDVQIPDEIKEKISGYEIVRCERTIDDRRIFMQGILSTVVQNPHYHNLLCPYTFLTFTDPSKIFGISSSSFIQSDVFSLISPEICVNKYGMNDIVKNRSLSIRPISTIYSKVLSTNTRFKTGYANNANYFIDPNGDLHRVGDYYDNYIIMSDIRHAYGFNTSSGDTLGGIPYIFKYYIEHGNTDDGRRIILGPDYDNLQNYYNIKSKKLNISDATFCVEEGKEPDWRMKVRTKSGGSGTGEGEVDTSIDYAIVTSSGKNYVNISDDSIRNEYSDADGFINSSRKVGPNGYCMIVTSADFNSKYIYEDAPSNPNSSDLIYVGNSYGNGSPDIITGVLKVNVYQNVVQYGGNSYSARSTSTYKSIGYFVNTDDFIVGRNIQTIVYGGDTYLCLLDYLKTSQWVEIESKPAYGGTFRTCLNAYIPFETTINLDLMSSDEMGRQVQNAHEYDSSLSYSDTYANNWIQNLPTVNTIYKVTQSKPLYVYNDAYSISTSIKSFVPNNMLDDKLSSPSYVLCSEQHIQNEIIDNLTKFKFANYLNVEPEHGAITKLITVGNKLLFLQERAFGILSVNERSLISDNEASSLVLGVGGILDRYDYISTTHGCAYNRVNSVIVTNKGIYWHDERNKEIVKYSNALELLTTNLQCKNLVSNCSSNIAYLDRDNIVFGNTNGLEDTRNPIYNEKLNLFVSDTNRRLSAAFINQEENRYILDASGNLFLLSPRNWKVHTTLDPYINNFRNKDNIGNNLSCIFTTVVNKYPDTTKVFDWVRYPVTNTIDNILFTTANDAAIKQIPSDLRKKERDYSIEVPRTMAPNNSNRLRDKFLQLQISINPYNSGGVYTSNNNFKYIKTIFRPSRF